MNNRDHFFDRLEVLKRVLDFHRSRGFHGGGGGTVSTKIHFASQSSTTTMALQNQAQGTATPKTDGHQLRESATEYTKPVETIRFGFSPQCSCK